MLKKIIFISLIFYQSIKAQDHWETAIFADDQWKYIVPNSELPTNWNAINFDDSFWLESEGGFGYGDDDDGTIINQTISVYFRKTFTVENLFKLSGAVISADYDDGFVAYLNSHEVARSYNLSEPGTFVPFDETTTYDHEASLYQGGFPDNIFLDSLLLDSLLVNGENVFSVQIHNFDITSSDMSGNFYLTFGITDESEFFSQPPTWFQEPVIYGESHLPLLVIDTYGAEIPDDPRIPAYMGIINNSVGLNYIDDDFNDYDGHITIERRGNSSQGNGKTPYRFETVDSEGENNNVQLLGLPEENDWVLYAPWQDKSMVRNILIYQLSNELGRYASKTKLVELYLNNEYRGIYVLMEKIKRDNNRVNISKLNPDEVEGDDLTGGYILKFDWYYTGDNIGGFESEYNGMMYNFHYPKPSDIVPEQEEYIENFIYDFETIMMGINIPTDSIAYDSIINIDSFVDFILLQELSKNVDAYRLSSYIYKDKNSIDSRLTAGPIWDFNHGFGNCDYGHTWATNNWLIEYDPTGDPIAFWWENLWQDGNFQLKISSRYTDLRSNIFSEQHINNIIDSTVFYLGDAIDRNFIRWPLLGNYVWPNYYVFDSYEEEIDYLKSWISNRLAWMDSQILLLNIDRHKMLSDVYLSDAYPNPFNPITTLKYNISKDELVNITIYDMLGNEINQLVNEVQSSGHKLIQWNATNNQGQQVSAGVYLYSIKAGDFKQTKKMILLK